MKQGFLIMGIGSLTDGHVQLLPRPFLIRRRNDAVGGSHTASHGGSAAYRAAMAANSSRNSSSGRRGVRCRKSLKAALSAHIRRRNLCRETSVSPSSVPWKMAGGMPSSSSMGKGVPLMAIRRLTGSGKEDMIRVAAQTPIDQPTTRMSVYSVRSEASKSRVR